MNSVPFRFENQKNTKSKSHSLKFLGGNASYRTLNEVQLPFLDLKWKRNRFFTILNEAGRIP